VRNETRRDETRRDAARGGLHYGVCYYILHKIPFVNTKVPQLWTEQICSWWSVWYKEQAPEGVTDWQQYETAALFHAAC